MLHKADRLDFNFCGVFMQVELFGWVGHDGLLPARTRVLDPVTSATAPSLALLWRVSPFQRHPVYFRSFFGVFFFCRQATGNANVWVIASCLCTRGSMGMIASRLHLLHVWVLNCPRFQRCSVMADDAFNALQPQHWNLFVQRWACFIMWVFSGVSKWFAVV